MRKHELAAGVALPDDAVTRRIAVLATSGAGKTYAAMKAAELMLAGGHQVIAIDVAGPWWGLRVDADGRSPGFNLAVLGGPHGDVPIVADGGALLADALVDTRVSAVIDLSEFSDADIARFCSAFAERFFARKKRAPSPVHLFVEEAHELMPQNPEREQNVMLNRWKRLTRQGRNHGIGWTLVSQAPQSLNKRCLNLAECVITLRLFGEHERKAVTGWVANVAPDPKSAVARVNTESPYLDDGCAFIWSPQWLKMMGERALKIAPKRTFDSSKTPEPGDLVVEQLPPPKTLDLGMLESAMGELVEQAKQDDPKALRAEVARLRAELAKVQKATPAKPGVSAGAPVVRVEEKRVEVPVLRNEQIKRLEAEVRRMLAAAEDLHSREDRVREIASELALALGSFATPRHVAPRPAAVRVRDPSAREQAPSGANGFRKGARAMLLQLARMGQLTRRQLATLAGMSPGSGTFGTYLSELRRAGYVVEEGGSDWAITEAGRAFVGPVDPKPPTTAALVEMWSGRFRAGARSMLATLVARYPERLTRDELAGAVNMSPDSGTFGTYLAELRSNGLIESSAVAGGGIAASPTLFLGATA